MINVNKFHNCNAHTETNGSWVMFVSYQTPIAILHYDSSNRAHLNVSNMFDCSATTRKQFSRWLRENGLNYYDVKETKRKAEKHGCEKAHRKAEQGPCIVIYGYEPEDLAGRFYSHC